MSLKNKTIVVTGGSRGLGLGLVEALVNQGARVTVVARDQAALAAVKQRLGVATISADVTDENAAHRILAQVRPDILVLNAGAKPRMGRLDQVSWADFTATWDTDVKAGLYWLQAALKLPLKPGSRVLVGSSGAAVNGSPMSGGYAGAKRMLWIMAKYANGVSAEKGLGICFQAIVPLQIIGGTGVGDAGANAYARAMGMKPEEFLARIGAPLPPREFGEKVVSILDDPKYAEGIAFGLRAAAVGLGQDNVEILPGGAHGHPAEFAGLDVVADLETQRVAVEAERDFGVVDGDEHCGNSDWHSTIVRRPGRPMLLRSCSVLELEYAATGSPQRDGGVTFGRPAQAGTGVRCGRVTTMLTHEGMTSLCGWSRPRYCDGVSPTISLKRELNDPSDVHPTATHVSVTDIP